MNRTLFVVGLTFVMTLTGMVTLHYFEARRNVWVDIKKLYEDFQCKKDIEKKINGMVQANTKVLDSLKTDLDLLYLELKNKPNNEKLSAKFNLLKQQYAYRKEKFEEYDTALKEEYQAQIIKQLNEYVKSYCKEKNIQYLFGADGSGFLMYADESKDITSDVTIYINNLYNGKK